jgi:hypothetical protein
MVLVVQVTTADYDATDHTLIDDINDRNVKPSTMDIIPRVNGADQEIPMKPRLQGHNGSGKISVPMHVLFNQAGRMCTRFNKGIKGTRVQQGFVQKLVSTIYGYSIPILFSTQCCFQNTFGAIPGSSLSQHLDVHPLAVSELKPTQMGLHQHWTRPECIAQAQFHQHQQTIIS